MSTQRFSTLGRDGAGQLFRLAACLAACLALAGCSAGFLKTPPDEGNSLHGVFFQDLSAACQGHDWLWVRGSIAGDFSGSGKAGEEAVVATVQAGGPGKPGPIKAAYLAVVKVDEGGGRRLLARTELFARNPIPGSPRPAHDLDQVVETPLTQVKAQILADKLTSREEVVAYFWGDQLPGSVWFAGYALDGGGLRRTLETAVWQRTPGFLSMDLDRNVLDGPPDYQAVIGVWALPPGLAERLGQPRELPFWAHVFARDPDGTRRQADRRYAAQYRRIAGRWNQVYLKALMEGEPPEELAWLEYRLALLSFYAGDAGLAAKFMEKAEGGARDPGLREAIRAGKEYIK